jgi:hypothetical protein
VIACRVERGPARAVRAAWIWLQLAELLHGHVGERSRVFFRAAEAPLRLGNTVRLLNDAAQNYPAWLEAIASAQQTVAFECYIIHDDEIGRTFADALIAKARAGDRHVLEPVEARLLTVAGLLAVTALVATFPRAVGFTFAAVAASLGLALLYRGYTVARTGRRSRRSRML